MTLNQVLIRIEAGRLKGVAAYFLEGFQEDGAILPGCTLGPAVPVSTAAKVDDATGLLLDDILTATNLAAIAAAEDAMAAEAAAKEALATLQTEHDQVAAARDDLQARVERLNAERDELRAAVASITAERQAQAGALNELRSQLAQAQAVAQAGATA